MNGCSKALGGVTAVLFIITTTAALFLFNLAAVVTDRAVVRAALADEEQLRRAVVDLVAAGLRRAAIEQGVPAQAVDAADLDAAVAQLLPPGWIEQQSNAALDALYDSLTAREPAPPEMTLDLSPLLPQLRGEPGRQVVLSLLNSLPPCPADAPLNVDPATGAIRIEDCLPPGLPPDAAADAIHGRLLAQLEANPNLRDEAFRLQFSPFAPGDPDARQAWQQIQRLYRLTRTGAWLLWLLPFGCLLLIPLFSVRSLRDLGLWWGWPLFLTGGLAIFLSLIPPLLLLLGAGLPGQSPGDQTALAVGRVTAALLGNVGRIWLARVRWQALVLLGAGLMFLFVGLIAPRRSEL